ncbi:MAG: DNA translocase FtsK 4TM domain-containing protein, partial [Bauldia sp.]
MRSTRSVPISLDSDGTLRRLAKRNIAGAVGLGVIALAAALAASLATWTVDDPSFSHATDHAARNVLGMPGAIVADLLMQFLGLAAALFLVPPVIWAWRLLFALPSRSGRLAVLAWVGGSLVAAAALATMPMPATWPLPTGLGGVAGDLLARLPALALGGELSTLANLLLGSILTVVAVALSLIACGFGKRASAVESLVAARGRAPAAKTARKPAVVEDDDADEDDRPNNFAILMGAMAHLRRRLGSGLRRL